jgi:hypothetical protein
MSWMWLQHVCLELSSSRRVDTRRVCFQCGWRRWLRGLRLHPIFTFVLCAHVDISLSTVDRQADSYQHKAGTLCWTWHPDIDITDGCRCSRLNHSHPDNRRLSVFLIVPLNRRLNVENYFSSTKNKTDFSSCRVLNYGLRENFIYCALCLCGKQKHEET